MVLWWVGISRRHPDLHPEVGKLFRRVSFAAILICALLVVAPASARKACLFLQVDLSETLHSGLFRHVVTDALAVDLRRASLELVPAPDWQEALKQAGFRDRELLDREVVLQVARELGAEVAVTGFLRLAEGRILLGFKSYETSTGQLSAAVLKQGPAGLPVYALINEVAAELVPRLLAPPPPLPDREIVVQQEKVLRETVVQEEEVDSGRKIRVTLRSPDEGAEVLLAGEEPAGVIEDGRLVLETQADSRLILTKRKDGYHEEAQEFRLRGKDRQLRLRPLKSKTQRSLELQYTGMQFIGLGGGYRHYLLPDRLFLGGDNYFYLQLPGPGVQNGSILYHDDLRALIGTYLLFPPSSPFRVGLSTGVGAIFTLAPIGGDLQLYTDLYWSYLSFWLEYSRSHWSAYYRVDGKYSLGLFSNLLGRRNLSTEGPPPMTVGVMWKW